MSATADVRKSIRAQTLLGKPQQASRPTNAKPDALAGDLRNTVYLFFSSNQARSVCGFPQPPKAFFWKQFKVINKSDRIRRLFIDEHNTHSKINSMYFLL